MYSTFGSEKNRNWVLTISCGAKNHMKNKFQLNNFICLKKIDNTFLTFVSDRSLEKRYKIQNIREKKSSIRKEIEKSAPKNESKFQNMYCFLIVNFQV